MPFLTLQGLNIPQKHWCSSEWLLFYNHYVHVSLFPDSLTQAAEQECTNPFEFSGSQIVICAGETVRCLNWAFGDHSSRERAIIRSCGDLQVDPQSHNLRWRQVRTLGPHLNQTWLWFVHSWGVYKVCSEQLAKKTAFGGCSLCWYRDKGKSQILMSRCTPHTNINY